MTENKYPLLLSPIQIGPVQLKNRAVVPALTTNFADERGFVTDRLIAYLTERARGEFGLIITENVGVHPTGKVMPKMVMGHHDDYLPGLKKLVDAIHEAGGTVFAQLSHAGRQTRSVITGYPLLSASPIPCPLNKETPLEMTVQQVEEMVEAFARAAVRMKQAGFDGIELHGAHGYLINQFLSPYSNKRTDQYGGSKENRLRFLMEIVQQIKQRTGDDYPLVVRLSVDEFMPDGLTVNESADYIRALEAVGVHAFNITAGVYGSFNKFVTVSGTPRGGLMTFAKQIKQYTTLPVIGVGRIHNSELAEKFLQTGYADLVAFGRSSMAEPHIIRKSVADDEPALVPCVSCNVCLGRTKEPESKCPTNPFLGHEYEWRVMPAQQRKKILVHGSGLPVLQLLHVLVARGHDVHYVPDIPVRGGYFTLRGKVPGQEEYEEASAYFLQIFKQNRVHVVQDQEPEESYDVRVTFTALPKDERQVHMPFAGTVMHAREALIDGVVAGASVAVVGANLLGAETALYLAANGADVCLLDANAILGFDAHPAFRAQSAQKLAEFGVKVFLAAEDVAFTAEGLLFSHDGKEVAKSVSHIVFAHEMPAVFDEADGPYATTYHIRDFYEPGKMTKEIYRVIQWARNV